MPQTDAPSYAAGLFQKAHEQIVAMQRIDAQIADLLSQRRSAQAALKDAQGEINSEFGRLMRESDELPAKILSEISGGENGQSTAPEAQVRARVTHPVA